MVATLPRPTRGCKSERTSESQDSDDGRSNACRSSVRVSITANVRNELLGILSRQKTLVAEWLVACPKEHLVQFLGLSERRLRATGAQRPRTDEHRHRHAMTRERHFLTFAPAIQELRQLRPGLTHTDPHPMDCSVLYIDAQLSSPRLPNRVHDALEDKRRPNLIAMLIRL